MTTPEGSTSDLLGPNAESVESFLRDMERATLAQLRAALARRSSADYAQENAAHVTSLGLAHRHQRLAAMEAARLLAVRVTATAIASAMVEATVEWLRGASTEGKALDETARMARARQEADDLCQLLLEAAEFTAEALVVRDLLAEESFTLLTQTFAGMMT